METFGSGRGRRRGGKHGSHAPPSVRPPSASLRLATSPGRPFLWSGLRESGWTLPCPGPLDCITPTCAVLLSPRLVPMQGRGPHSSLFYRDFVCPHPVCHTFRFGEWGQQETLDGNGFRYPKAKVVFLLCRFSSGTRGCKCNHIFKGWLLLLVLSQHRGPIYI